MATFKIFMTDVDGLKKHLGFVDSAASPEEAMRLFGYDREDMWGPRLPYVEAVEMTDAQRRRELGCEHE